MPELRFGPPKKLKMPMKPTTPEETDKEKDELESSEEEFAAPRRSGRVAKKIVDSDGILESDGSSARRKTTAKGGKGKHRAVGIKGLSSRPASPKGPAVQRVVKIKALQRVSRVGKAKGDHSPIDISESTDRVKTTTPKSPKKVKVDGRSTTRLLMDFVEVSARPVKPLPKRAKAQSTQASRDLSDRTFDEGEKVDLKLVPLLKGRVGLLVFVVLCCALTSL